MTEPVFPSNTWWIKIRGLIGCLGCPGTKRNVGWCQSELNVLSSSSSFAPVWTFSASSNLSPALSRSRSLLFPFVSLSLCASPIVPLSLPIPNRSLQTMGSRSCNHTSILTLSLLSLSQLHLLYGTTQQNVFISRLFCGSTFPSPSHWQKRWRVYEFWNRCFAMRHTPRRLSLENHPPWM